MADKIRRLKKKAYLLEVVCRRMVLYTSNFEIFFFPFSSKIRIYRQPIKISTFALIDCKCSEIIMKIAIIGAGIGGLTTAIALEQKKIAYQIFEKFPKMIEMGAGIWLAPNALQVYQYLDLLEEVKLKGNSIDRITIGKPDLSAISDNPQDAIKAKFGYSAIAIHRAALQRLLLNKIPKEKIHLGKSFASFENSANGKTNLFFGDGSTFEADYLIGADGINSSVRKQLFPESQQRYTGQTCWRGVANTQLDKEFDNRVYELWGNQIRFGLSRIADGKYYWFAVALDKPNQVDNQSKVQEKLLNMFKPFHPIVTQLIKTTPTSKVVRNDINDLQPLSNWYKNNVCLIGDAGHATTPNMGQGGAQAIEDAYYLSHFLANHASENVFQLFQQERQSKVNSIVKQSWTTGKMAHWKYGTSFRNLLLKSIPKKLLVKKMIDMYEIEKYD